MHLVRLGGPRLAVGKRPWASAAQPLALDQPYPTAALLKRRPWAPKAVAARRVASKSRRLAPNQQLLTSSHSTHRVAWHQDLLVA